MSNQLPKTKNSNRLTASLIKEKMPDFYIKKKNYLILTKIDPFDYSNQINNAFENSSNYLNTNNHDLIIGTPFQ